jgi:prepilin-type N-terminal cleavage/methylation domain-containing protein
MRGATLPEMLTVLLIVGVLASLVMPPLRRTMDQLAVDGAASTFAAMHERARSLAVARSRLSRIELDSVRGDALVLVRDSLSGWDTLDVRPLGRVRFSASRVVVTFSPVGIGFGLSNTRIVFSSGAAAETLTVSRTGRLRRS